MYGFTEDGKYVRQAVSYAIPGHETSHTVGEVVRSTDVVEAEAQAVNNLETAVNKIP
jgi:hypothetical protein